METVRISEEFFCGVDLHARTIFICVMNRDGKILLKRNITNNFKIFKGFMESFLPDLAVGCASTYNYYWLLDGCTEAQIPFQTMNLTIAIPPFQIFRVLKFLIPACRGAGRVCNQFMNNGQQAKCQELNSSR